LSALVPSELTRHLWQYKNGWYLFELLQSLSEFPQLLLLYGDLENPMKELEVR